MANLDYNPTKGISAKRDDIINQIVTNNGMSVSHATMRNEDLIPTFIEVLFALNREKARNVWKDNINLLTALCDKQCGKEGDEYWESDDATEVCFSLFDLLDSESPNGFYFGSNEGDLCDYGFWRNESDDDE